MDRAQRSAAGWLLMARALAHVTGPSADTRIGEIDREDAVAAPVRHSRAQARARGSPAHGPLATRPTVTLKRWAIFAATVVSMVMLTATGAFAQSSKYSAPLTVDRVIINLAQEGDVAGRSNRTDEEILIMEMLLGDVQLTDATFGYANSGSLILPLTEFVNALDFPIDVDPINGRASGWFIAENRLFSLDLASGQVVIGGRRETIDLGLIEVLPDDIFVDVRQLARWFPLDIEFDLANLQINLTAREPLPLQQRLARQQARDRRFGQTAGKTKDYEQIDVPYALATFPVSDTTTEISLNRDADGNTVIGQTVSSIATADLAKLNAELFTQGTDKETFNQVRLKLSRRDPNGLLFADTAADDIGLGGATEFSIGDITSVQTPLVSRSRLGRGVMVTNQPFQQPNEFDQITLQGNLPIGWEVELYRNEILLDFAEPSSAGRYLFEDVPLLFGVNILRLVFYGPQGQQREEIQQIRVGPDQITPGDLQYRFSANQQEAFFLTGREDEPTDADLVGRARTTAELRYGVSKELSLGAQFTSVPQANGVRKYYQGLTMATSQGPLFIRADLVKDLKAGWALESAIQGRVLGVNTIFTHTHLSNFQSEQFTATDPLLDRLKLRLDGVVRAFDLPHLPYNITTTHDRQKSGAWSTDFENRLSTAIGRATVSNTFIGNLSHSPGPTSTASMSGSLLLGGRIADIRVRGALNYGVVPNNELTDGSITGDWKISSKISGRAGLSKELTGTGTTTYSMGANADVDIIALGLNLQYADSDVLSGTLNATYSWGKDDAEGGLRLGSKPTAERGTLQAKVYFDTNDNGEFDDNEDEVLQGVTFKVGGSFVQGETNENGVAFLTGVPTFQPVDFELDTGSLENPFWIADPVGVTVITRPGVSGVVEFRVVTTGEIDGTVFRQLGDSKRPVSDVVLQLLDDTGNVVREVKSAYDGFYLFDFLRPGAYSLRINPEQLMRLGLIGQEAQAVSIEGDGTILSGQDFTLQSNRPSQEPDAPDASSDPDKADS